jgi:diguanylate cyclase (GGDEF)-like protein/PAS domain S-box-containing protein
MKETILVVDDNRQIVDFIARKVLPSLGYETVVAFNGKRAIEIVRTTRLSLILLDLQLPDVGGLDILRQLASEGYTIPTILMTAHGSEQVAADAFRLGVQDYLPKPVDSDTLNAAITRALSQTRLKQEKARLTRQLQEQVTWLTVLSKVGRSVTSTLDLDEVLRRITEAGVRLTQAEEGFLALLDEENSQLYLRAAKNIDEDRVKTMRIRVTDAIMSRVIATGSPWRSTQDSPPLKVSTGYLVQSLIYIPLVSKGRILGVLSVDNRIGKRVFSQTDESLLTSLADYAAIALENASLYDKSQQEIAERKRIEVALRESEERYALAVQGANDGLWDWNLKTNQIYYSPRWKSMIGYQEYEIGNGLQEWFSRIHPEDKERVRLDVAAHIKGLTSHFNNEHRILHRDGTYRWVLSRGVAVKDDLNIAYRLAGSLSDVTDRKSAEEKLTHDAFYDTLTGLANRILLMDRLTLAVERAKRRKDYRFAVLFLDLDHFKDVNDSMGHLVGDRLLIAIADALKKEFRSTDTVARFGGDEFVILLEDIADQNDVFRIADWIQKQISQPFSLSGRDVYMTASIGVVSSLTGYERAEDVLRDADIAMYTAKAGGRARYAEFDPSMRDRLMDRIALETELHQALERGEFRVYYQPIVLLQSRSYVGFEALVRWQHPTRGLLVPSYFLSLAEETGLIIQIDRWVLKQACIQMRAWQDKYPATRTMKISVNFSGKQVAQPDFYENVESTLRETGLDPHCLNIEMTENTVMNSDQAISDIFSKLRALGVQTQIDDFGVGYSSLNYLSQFHVDALKIDQTFISEMNEDNNRLKIVQAIVKLTEQLGVNVIAEGVETDLQMEQLKGLGCEFGQGYLIAAPLDAQSIENLLLPLEISNSENSNS